VENKLKFLDIAKPHAQKPEKPAYFEPRPEGGFGQGEKAPRAGLYARVSTYDQQTLPMQLAAMRDYARKRKWTVTVEVKDVGSGATTRPKRESLIAAAQRREIDLVLVWRLDRWGRSLVDLVSTLQELNALEVGFVSLSEALDLTTPSGRALAGMLAVFAEFERDILRDRVKAGIAQARSEGKLHGWPKTAANLVPEMRRLRKQGLSKRAIAKRLSVSRLSVIRLLRRKKRA
jgi:putative DNA-invertase from lambdoid prophage Rac